MNVKIKGEPGFSLRYLGTGPIVILRVKLSAVRKCLRKLAATIAVNMRILVVVQRVKVNRGPKGE